MDDNITSLVINDTWKLFHGKSISDNIRFSWEYFTGKYTSDYNLFSGTVIFKYIMKSDNIRKFKACYFKKWLTRRDCLLNPWTHTIQWSSDPQWGKCWFCGGFYFCIVKILTSQMPFFCRYYNWGSSIHWTYRLF